MFLFSPRTGAKSTIWHYSRLDPNVRWRLLDNNEIHVSALVVLNELWGGGIQRGFQTDPIFWNSKCVCKFSDLSPRFTSINRNKHFYICGTFNGKHVMSLLCLWRCLWFWCWQSLVLKKSLFYVQWYCSSYWTRYVVHFPRHVQIHLHPCTSISSIP